MQLPLGGLVTPAEYLSQGMSFDDMLLSYKKHMRSRIVQSMDDEPMDTGKRKEKNLNINKKGQGGGIKKDSSKKKTTSLYDSKRPSSGASVVVKNIPYSSSEDDLRAHFTHIAKVTNVRLHKDENNRSLGSGSVTFSNRKDALVVVESMQDTKIGGRPITIVLVE